MLNNYQKEKSKKNSEFFMLKNQGIKPLTVWEPKIAPTIVLSLYVVKNMCTSWIQYLTMKIL